VIRWPNFRFELELQIFVFVELYIKLGIDLGFLGFLTLYKYSYTITVILFEAEYTPDPPCSITSDDSLGIMTLQDCPLIENNELACTHLAGPLGDEEIGCDIVGECPTFNVSEYTKRVSLGRDCINLTAILFPWV